MGAANFPCRHLTALYTAILDAFVISGGDKLFPTGGANLRWDRLLVLPFPAAVLFGLSGAKVGAVDPLAMVGIETLATFGASLPAGRQGSGLFYLVMPLFLRLVLAVGGVVYLSSFIGRLARPATALLIASPPRCWVIRGWPSTG